MNAFTDLFARNSLIISCQAGAGHPLRDSATMARMAVAGEQGGARGVRANGVHDVRAIHAVTSLPVIGIVKVHRTDGVFITPTLDDAVDVLDAGAAVVAIDGTARIRPDGSTFAMQLRALRRARPAVVMADVDTVEAGIAAWRAGADAIATTLSGYTKATSGGSAMSGGDGPDVALVAALVAEVDCPVVAEGRIRHTEDIANVRDAGAYAVVVGGAITDPVAITARLVKELHVVGHVR